MGSSRGAFCNKCQDLYEDCLCVPESIEDSYLSEDGTANPKKAIGALKAPMCFVPDTSLIELEAVMAGGAYKYGPFNFRQSKIDAQTYIAAIKRHLAIWADGVDIDDESGRSHLAHIMACCALALDAQHTDMFIDNRSKTGLVEALLKDCADSHNNFCEDFDKKKLRSLDTS